MAELKLKVGYIYKVHFANAILPAICIPAGATGDIPTLYWLTKGVVSFGQVVDPSTIRKQKIELAHNGFALFSGIEKRLMKLFSEE